MKVMSVGVALVCYAATDDLQGFKRLSALADPYLVLWHEQRAFKEAIKHKSVKVIEHLVDSGLDLQQQCFQ